MWPDEAATRYCGPRKRLMVLALVGDSTTMSLGIQHLQQGCHHAGQGPRGDMSTRRTRCAYPMLLRVPLYIAQARLRRKRFVPWPVMSRHKPLNTPRAWSAPLRGYVAGS